MTVHVVGQLLFAGTDDALYRERMPGIAITFLVLLAYLIPQNVPVRCLCVKRFPGTVVARGALRHVAEGLLHALEPLAPPQEASILEHGAALGMQRPVASLTRLIGTSGNLNKAVVEREVVAKGVLPPLLVLPVEGKVVDDELVDLGQREHLPWRTLDRHRGQ